MTLSLIHVVDDYVDLHSNGHQLFRYVYAPKTPLRESPKPYFHPLRTLAGNEVTIFRPYDHVWHKGLAMTMAQLSGQNFWGGPTYVHGQGYVELPNYGRIVHRVWDRLQRSDVAIHLGEQLDWLSHDGQRWLGEQRQIMVSEINPERGYWCLDLRFTLQNVTDRLLRFGSPTTEGRPLAGYGGLFWRGPRSFLHARLFAADGLEGPEIMGKAARWLAVVGRHDGSGDASTLLFLDHPTNPRFPNPWFVRNDPYACVSFAFSFDSEYLLEPTAELRLRYRIVIADGEWNPPDVETAVRSGGW